MPDARIGELLAEATATFWAGDVHPPPARRDAVLLLAEVVERPESWVRAHDEVKVASTKAERFRDLCRRRAGGEPFAYLVGRREFWGRSFAVDDRVLVPRPETEHLVEAVLGLDLPPRPRILDLGVGSGVLAATLVAEIPGARAIGGDRSIGALAVAAANGRRLLAGTGDDAKPSGAGSRAQGVEAEPQATSRLSLVAGDLADALVLDGVDLVVSNPPYLDVRAPEVEEAVRRWEPADALWAEREGRAVLDRLLDLRSRLRPGTWMVVEIGHDQGSWIEAEARRRGWSDVRVRPDLAGRDRTFLARSR